MVDLGELVFARRAANEALGRVQEFGMRNTRPTLELAVTMLALSLIVTQLGSALARPQSHKQSPPTEARPATVLFMCPHGAAKSALALAYFPRLAKKRGLNVRVDAVGIEPQDAVSTVVDRGPAECRRNSCDEGMLSSGGRLV